MASASIGDQPPGMPNVQGSIFDLGPGTHECWYPVALTSQIPVGQVIGRDMGSGRIVVYRGADGELRALSAFCKHMGADLSIGGEVVENDIRCPYHHWAYGDGGACTRIPSGDQIPRRAKLANFVVKEQYGLVWVFFGAEPLYEIPTFEDFNDEDYLAKSYEIVLCDELLCEPWMFTTNIFDFVHLKFLHHIDIRNSKIEEISEFHRRMSWDADLGEKAGGGWRPQIDVYGMNSIRTMGDQNGRLKWYIAASVPLGREGTKFFITVITTRGEGDTEFLDRQAMLHNAIMNEDVPVLNNMRYGDFQMVASDKAMIRFMRSVPKYPRTTMHALEKAAAMAASG